MQHAEEQPLTEQTAWEHLRIFLGDFQNLWGKPIALSRWIDFPKREYSVCTAWLRGLEAWLRRLILIAASRITPPPAPEAKQHPQRVHQTAGFSFATDDSADWRVSFRVGASRRTARGKRGRSYRRLEWDPVPLALRFEALLRVARNPEPYIARAARVLAKNVKLPNALFAQKLKKMSALRPYVAQSSLLLLDVFPEAWRAADTS